MEEQKNITPALNPEQHPDQWQPRYALLAGGSAVAIVAILIIIKTIAYYNNESASMLASLTDSIMDAAISLMSFFSIRLSLKPADKEHRHGHGKIEGIAALFQAAFISGACVFLVMEAAVRWSRPLAMENYNLSIFVMSISVVLSLLLVFVQNYALKRAPSLAVEADKAHYSMDIAVNIGVILTLLILQYAGNDWAWIDPAFAILVAVYMGHTVWEIGGKGFDMLLDRELPEEIRKKIINIIQENKEIIGFHDLRTRQTGMTIAITFDLDMEPDQSLWKAHETAVEVECALLSQFPHAEIMIHMDPVGAAECRRRKIGQDTIGQDTIGESLD